MTKNGFCKVAFAIALPLAMTACSASGITGALKKSAENEAATGEVGADGATELAAAAPDTVADGVRVGFCPKVQLITNEETYRTFEGRDRSIDNIVYQASLYDVTRSCTVDGNQLTIDITAAGRLLAGPKGSAGGSLKMPIRVAVKDSSGVPYSELETYSAAMKDGLTSDQFVYRRSTVTIPATSDRRTTVLIGFDEGPQPDRS